MKIEINRIYNEDCIETMARLEDKSVDLVLTDPPYELKWKTEITFQGRKNMYHHREKTVMWDGNVRELYGRIFAELDRVVGREGSVILFTRSEFITWAVEAAKANNFDSKATIVWHKTNPMPQVRKKNYLSSIETILWTARYDEKKCPFTFNFKKQNEMHNFIEMPLCGGGERTEHPTQKPLKLIMHLLEIHSNENDLIYDPFLGSGTTAVACERLNRRWIGSEISAEYCQIAKRRIQEERDKLILFNESTEHERGK